MEKEKAGVSLVVQHWTCTECWEVMGFNKEEVQIHILHTKDRL
jgi:hypothetical protein